jgi:hypothetical protein
MGFDPGSQLPPDTLGQHPLIKGIGVSPNPQPKSPIRRFSVDRDPMSG